jgi:8-oxo-dGTP pyrophosphatase MutT (NUDIX family)
MRLATQRWKPHVTVAGIIEADGRFLLVEERSADGLRINQPAGHMEDGETLIEAVVREVLEESACRFVPEWMTGIYQWRDVPNDRTFMRFAFCGRAAAPDPALRLDEGIERTLWLTRDEVAGAAERFRSPWVLICIDDYLSGQRLPLDAIRSL